MTTVPGITIPAGLDLTAGWTVFVTLEPAPDNDVAPFFLRVLSGAVPVAPLIPSAPLANTTASFPTGLVTFE